MPAECGFPCAPIVLVLPVLGQLAGAGQWEALAPVVHGLVIGPSSALQPLLEVGEDTIGTAIWNGWMSAMVQQG